MEKKENKKSKIIITTLILLIIVFVIISILIYNNSKNTNTPPNENNSEANRNSSEESNTLIAEIEKEEEKWEWQYDIPENHNIDITVLNSIHNTIDSYPINAEVIIKDGVIVDEYYKEGYDKNSIFTLQSCSKSITSAIMGIAMDKGYIESVDTPISNYFPQILESNSEYLKEITIWNLLTHTTGFNVNESANWNEWRNSENWVDYVLNRQVTSRPGIVFNYFTGNTHLLSAIIQRATGETLYEFGKEYLFEPLDMDSVECLEDAQGISDGGNGFSMTIYDMAKFGQLYLNNGVWEGEQIIPEEWVKESTSVQFRRYSGTANYGYQWWVRTFGEQNYDAYFAQGYAGQFIFVVPDLELVTVFTSNYEGSSSIYWQLMNNIVDRSKI